MLNKLEDFSGGLSIGKSINEDGAKNALSNALLIGICFIASFTSFWNVTLTFDTAIAITWTSVLLYIVTTTVFSAKYEHGITNGKNCDRYKNAISELGSKRKEILEKDLIDHLSDWCNAFVKKELIQTRKSIIGSYMTYEDYTEKYASMTEKDVSKSSLPNNIKKAIKRANSIEPVVMTADMLLSVTFDRQFWWKRRVLPKSGDEQRRFDYLSNYISKFILIFLFGMVVIDIVGNPTLETFLQWLVRMIPISLAYLNGEISGYKNTTEVAPARIEAQIMVLERYYSEQRSGNHVEKKETVIIDNSGD